MRIAFLSVFYPYRGGIAQFNERLVEELLIEHEVKAFNYSLQYPSLLFPGKSQYVNKGESAWSIETERSLNSINPISWRKTAKAIINFDPELLVVRLWIPFLAPSSTNVIHRIKRKIPRLKVVAILDNVIPHEKRPFDRSWSGKFLKSCDRFIVMSESVVKDLKSFVPNPNYELVDHPINDRFINKLSKIECREKLKIGERDSVVLFFGFIRDYKGLDILIEAKALSRTSWKLLIVGECYGSFNHYQELINKHGLREEILVNNNYVDDTELQIYFNASDLCALPYKSATQSGIIPVAMHFNLPVITSNVGGLAEYVENGKSGIVLSNNSPAELAKEIDSFFNDNKASELKLGTKVLKEKYSWKRFSKAISKS